MPASRKRCTKENGICLETVTVKARAVGRGQAHCRAARACPMFSKSQTHDAVKRRWSQAVVPHSWVGVTTHKTVSRKRWYNWKRKKRTNTESQDPTHCKLTSNLTSPAFSPLFRLNTNFCGHCDPARAHDRSLVPGHSCKNVPKCGVYQVCFGHCKDKRYSAAIGRQSDGWLCTFEQLLFMRKRKEGEKAVHGDDASR